MSPGKGLLCGRLYPISGIVVGMSLFVLILSWGCSDSSDESSGGKDIEGQPATDFCGEDAPTPPEECSSCHGAPPTDNGHVQNKRCYRCHGIVVDENYEFVDETKHTDQKTDAAVGCSSCHGWTLGVSPPENLEGHCEDGTLGIGTHAAMRRVAIPAHKTACTNCHTVPLSTDDEGHIDGDNVAEVKFKFLATANGAEPVWNGKTCSNVYCHGGTLEGGFLKEPNWYDVSGEPSHCGACHRLTDPSGNVDADCNSCHPTSVTANKEIIPNGTHINGTIDMPEGESK